VSAGASDLIALVEAELARPAPPEAAALAEEIRRRWGGALAAILFYGSCLRRGSPEGVLDFYALVDSYQRAYPSRALALANAWLPPNVFYLEAEGPAGPLRGKVAVMSLSEFERATSPRALRASVWARFCQPALRVHARDEEASRLCARACASSVVTAFERLLPLLPASDGSRPFRADEFWELVFRETYRSEMRPESDAAIRQLTQAAPERYARAARGALVELEARGFLALEDRRGQTFARLPGELRRRGARSWNRRRRLAKLLYAGGLVKTAFTFGDWVPYALWKLERHSGARIVPSRRQREHPFLFGWPLLLRLLRRRELR
jgi:hypothetical protein